MEAGGDSSNPCAVFIPTTLAHMKTWARHHSKNEFCPLVGLVSFSRWVKTSVSHGNWLRLKRFCFLEGWVWHGSIPWSHFLQWPHGQTIAMVQLWRGRASTGWQLFKVALLPKEKFPRLLNHVSTLFLAATLLDPVACQFNSLDPQKTNLAEKSRASFIFNKPSGITKDKQQSHC